MKFLSKISKIPKKNFSRIKKNLFQKKFFKDFFSKIFSKKEIWKILRKGVFRKNLEKNFEKKFEKKISKKICYRNFMSGKIYFILQDFWKLFFRKWNLPKLVNGSWDMIIFTLTSKTYNSDVSYPNEIFFTFKW